MRIVPPCLTILGQYPIGIASMFIEQLRQHRTVLEASVHSLPVEGNHRVGCISDDYRLSTHIVRLALDHHQRLWLDLEEILYQPFPSDQIDRVREVGFEELQQVPFALNTGKVGKRHEQRHRPGAILVWQGNHHKLAPGPNVQKVVLHCKLSVPGRWNAQLQVTVLDVGLAKVVPRTFDDLLANCTVRSIATHDQVGFSAGSFLRRWTEIQKNVMNSSSIN